MPLIDDRGYLFGRVNLIDAVAVFLLLWCIPLGYGAYRLFRTPVPEIVSVTPQTIIWQPQIEGKERELKVTLEARNLRPFLRASAGPNEVRLLFENPTRAEIILPLTLQPGTYDLIIYDLTQEIARRKDAIVITAPAPPAAPPPLTTIEVEVLGAFTDLDAATAKKLGVSQKLGQTGQTGFAEIRRLEVPKPEMMRLRGIPLEGYAKPNAFRVPALLQLRCAMVDGDCRIDGKPLAPGGVVVLTGPTSALRFEITDVYPKWADWTAVNVRGAFIGLDKGEAERLARTSVADSRNRGSWSQLLSLSPPSSEVVQIRNGSGPISGTTGRYRVAALAAIRCSMAGTDCKVGSVSLAAGAVFPMLTAVGVLRFQVAELYPGATTHVDVTMLCATDPKLLSLVQADLTEHKSADQAIERGMAPELVAVREVTPDAKLATGVGGFNFEQSGAIFSVVIRVPAEETAAGWQSGTTLLRAGEHFVYAQPSYVLNGLITRVEAASPQREPSARTQP